LLGDELRDGDMGRRSSSHNSQGLDREIEHESSRATDGGDSIPTDAGEHGSRVCPQVENDHDAGRQGDSGDNGVGTTEVQGHWVAQSGNAERGRRGKPARQHGGAFHAANGSGSDSANGSGASGILDTDVADECGTLDGMGNTASHDEQRDSVSGTHRQGKSARRSSEPTASPSWSDFYVAEYRDGKSRRVGAGIQPLAHGVPRSVGLLLSRLESLRIDPSGISRKIAADVLRLARSSRVTRLRGYGNSITIAVASEFIKAAMESSDEISLQASKD
jgi:hypothetical protein